MIRLGFYNYYDFYNKNRIFNPEVKAPLGDDLLYPFHYLAKKAREKGISVSTIDTEPLDSYDAIIFLDFPGKNNQYFMKLQKMKFENLYLFLFENEIIKPDNWAKENYPSFKKIFTWRDDIVDNKIIFKFFLPNKIPEGLSFDPTRKKKFSCMIAGHKNSKKPRELYSERIRAIRWFEENHPESFDLYGKGWGYEVPSVLAPLSPVLKPVLGRYFRRYPSYLGEINSKRTILEQYKFSICYENMGGIPGYITEKIFDSFFAGCVPIYLGASNVSDFIPDETFIDMRKFSGYSDLYSFLIQLSEDDYRGYLDAISGYVGGQKILPFGAESFAELIFNEIAKSVE